MRKSGYIYHASGKETFDSIALSMYGDEKYASDLMSANPELTGKIVFVGGEKLFLPIVEEEDTEGLPTTAPWKE